MMVSYAVILKIIYLLIVVNLQLSEDDSSQPEEANAAMEIAISKNPDVFLANPIRFRITPLTVQQALDRGIIDTVPDAIGLLDPRSPNRAGIYLTGKTSQLQ